MNRCDWIICERSGHWTAAIRAAIRREKWPQHSAPRIREVRRTAEMSERLAAHGNSLAIIEASPANFADVLDWLASAARHYPQAGFAVLVDYAVSERGDRQLLVDLLREAGAHEVVISPRALRGLFALGQRHATSRAALSKSAIHEAAIEDRLRAMLPWQDE